MIQLMQLGDMKFLQKIHHQKGEGYFFQKKKKPKKEKVEWKLCGWVGDSSLSFALCSLTSQEMLIPIPGQLEIIN